MKDSSKTLFALAEVDKEIQDLSVKKSETESKLETFSARIEAYKGKLEEVEGIYKESASRQALEEHRLKDEETKIVERRKQLTTLGGAKSAKLVERELDIATRVMETMEKTAMEAMEVTTRLEEEKALIEDKLKELEAEYAKDAKDGEGSIADCEKQLSSLEKKRETLLGKVDDRLRNLYKKVNIRYPGDSIAIVRDGACRSCYRALPAQMYNQVIAGNMLLQCPGCSRILIYGGEAEAEARA